MDDKALNQAMDILIAFGFFFLLVHVYHQCLPWFQTIGAYGFLGKYGMMFLSSLGLFKQPWVSKFLAIGLAGMGIMGKDGKLNRNAKAENAIPFLIVGVLLFFFATPISNFIVGSTHTLFYAVTIVVSFFAILFSISYISRSFGKDLLDDLFNKENESFPQEERFLETPYSINLPTRYYHRGKWKNGWINVVNPFRATLVMGTPGAGKSYAVINNYIKQHIEKGFAMYVYDFKFPDLSKIAYNHFQMHKDVYRTKFADLGDGKGKVRFCCINFDDPRRSHRCNPIKASLMTDYIDAKETSTVIQLNLNREWVQKEGEFFVESAKILFAAVIWFLKLYEDGKYCTLPHAIEFMAQDYRKWLPILSTYSDLENDLSMFLNAAEGGAVDQLQGQLASAQLGVTRLTSKKIYWTLSGDDFTLDLNNPNDSKILCVGNNPENQTTYSAVLALFNSRISKLVNKKKQRPFSMIVDELPTIYFRGVDNLIATARSNKVSICLGVQDLSQLVRDYGKDQATALQNTIANVFCGQVMGETAKDMSSRFGRIVQQNESLNINKTDTSSSLSTHLDEMIPQSKISSLSQGEFVGSVADERGYEIPQPIFNASIVIDAKKVDAEMAKYEPIPILTVFDGTYNPETGEHLSDEEAWSFVEKAQNENFYKIKKETRQIVEDELLRIRNPYDMRYSMSRARDMFYKINDIDAKEKVAFERDHYKKERDSHGIDDPLD